MCKAAEVICLKVPKGQLRFTASFGVFQVKDFSEIELSVNKLSINEADAAMYLAKQGGRNGVYV